jgi:2-polyprenyl-6-methoxyphenol hydroxylase-like FAD-dependent oxidoreductase
MEFFRRLGLADQIRDAGLPPDHPTDIVYLTAMGGQEITRYSLPPSAMAKQSSDSLDSGWPTPEPQHRISQLYLEPILHARARELDQIDFWEGWRFTGYEPDGDHVVASLESVENWETRTVRARYLVGAEGARSVVRRTMGAVFEGNPSVARSLSTFIRCPALGELSRERAGWMYRVLGPTRYHRFVAIDGADRFIYHLTLGHDDDPAAIDLETELAEGLGMTAEFEILGQVDWVARAMVADRFYRDNVFLVGDAAHIWIPMGGFGMNAGVADATNLSWKLTAALDGWAGPHLLDSYEQERKPMGELVAAAAVGINTDLLAAIRTADGIHGDDEAAAGARAELGDVIAAANTTEFNSIGMQLGYVYDRSGVIVEDSAPMPEFSLGTFRPTSHPGIRAPHAWLEDGTSLFDHLGSGFTLLVLGGGLDPSAFITAAITLGVPLEVLSVETPELRELYENYLAVLIRPDQHIAWRGTELVDPAQILARSVGFAG